METETVAIAALITNIVLAAITAIYAGLTFWMARTSKRSAAASEAAASAAQESAEAAKDAAIANKESVAVARAALDVKFTLEAVGHGASLVEYFSVKNDGRAAVYVHAFELVSLFHASLDDDGRMLGRPILDKEVLRESELLDEGVILYGILPDDLLHHNDEARFYLKDPVTVKGESDFADVFARVHYSADSDLKNSRTYPVHSRAHSSQAPLRASTSETD